MARKLRVQYPGALYHLINRGGRREPIFKDDRDRRQFLKTLGESCAKTGWHESAVITNACGAATGGRVGIDVGVAGVVEQGIDRAVAGELKARAERCAGVVLLQRTGHRLERHGQVIG